MAIVFVSKLGKQSYSGVLDRRYYRIYRFRYRSYNIENSIMNDMNKVELGDVDFSGRAVAIFRMNAQSRIFRREVLEMIMMQIGTSLVQSNELMWTYKNDKSLHKHELEVTLHIPVTEKAVLEFEIVKPSVLKLR